VDDCDVGKSGKRACKNCTCGRAEMEEQAVKLTPEMLENPQSACGSVSADVLPFPGVILTACCEVLYRL
jgi:hypothetical protein